MSHSLTYSNKITSKYAVRIYYRFQIYNSNLSLPTLVRLHSHIASTIIVKKEKHNAYPIKIPQINLIKLITYLKLSKYQEEEINEIATKQIVKLSYCQ